MCKTILGCFQNKRRKPGLGRLAPLNTVGAYQPATANQTSAVYPQLAGTNPWILPPASQFVPENFANLSHAKVRVAVPALCAHMTHPLPKKFNPFSMSKYCNKRVRPLSSRELMRYTVPMNATSTVALYSRAVALDAPSYQTYCSVCQ